MSQAQFSEFMSAQCEAIEASGLECLAWIALHAESFRQTWEEAHNSPTIH